MNNLILSITRNIIPYVKELRIITGSVTASILMQQLDYWFSKMPDGFYKFVEPCQHPNYTIGDSWCEELGFSPDEFRTAYEKIGVRYKSKSEFLASKDTFQNKFYASYHDRGKNQVFYVRNHDLVDQKLTDLIRSTSQKSNINGSSTRNRKSRITVNGKSPFTETDNPQFQKPTIPSSIYGTDTTTEITTEKSLSNEIKRSHRFGTPEREMMMIWNQIVEEGKRTINLTAERGTSLSRALSSHFENTLEEWKIFCQKTASSKFLMGEITAFKANIDWALKDEIINKIKEGGYGVGDRKTEQSTAASHPIDQTKTFEDCLLSIYESKNSSQRFKTFLESVLKKVGHIAYGAWFNAVTEGEGDENTIVILARSRFVENQITQRFLNILRQVASANFGSSMAVRVVSMPT